MDESPAAVLASNADAASPVQFVDVAREAGLNAPNVWGGADHKRYIIEAKGSGMAFFDYDQDGWLDIYLTNGTRLGETWPAGQAPTSHLYKNNRDGTLHRRHRKIRPGAHRLADRRLRRRLRQRRLGRSVLLLLGTQHPVPQQRRRNVHRCHPQGRGLRRTVRWGAGCTFLDYDRDGHLDLFVCNYIKLDPAKTPSADDPAACQWKGIPVMCGPRGLAGDTNVLYHNNGDGTFTDVSEKAGILKPGPRYSITAVSTISITTAGRIFTSRWTPSPASCSTTTTTALSPTSP